jgi:hypothetical protein
LGESGAGVNGARSEVRIEPRTAGYLDDTYQGYERALAQRLYSIGWIADGHADVVLDEDGRTYLYYEGELHPLAPRFDQALELLLIGKRPSADELQADWPDWADEW